MSVSLTGSDTVKIDTRLLADLADGDCVALTNPNDIATVKTGKDGNTIYGLNESGKQSEAAIRVIRGSPDDKYLNNRMAQQLNDFASFVLLNGEFTKRVGDGSGKVTSDKYIMGGGVFSKKTDAKSNVEGDTEQSVVVYHVKFANAPRVIG